jgi:hypothetical protein
MGLILLSFAAGSFLPAELNLLGRLLGETGVGITRGITGL